MIVVVGVIVVVESIVSVMWFFDAYVIVVVDLIITVDVVLDLGCRCGCSRWKCGAYM